MSFIPSLMDLSFADGPAGGLKHVEADRLAYRLEALELQPY
jgi:hypothetical protein